MAWRFVSSRHRRKWYQESSLEVTACFMSAPAANCLPVSCFIRGPKIGKSVGLFPPTILVVGYGATAGRLWTAFTTVLILCAVFCFCLNTIRIAWLGNGSWQTVMWNKFPPPAYRQLTPVSLMLGYRPWYDGWTRGKLIYLAPLGSENISAPYFKQCFFRGGSITSQTVKHHASQSQNRNNK